uniref:Uncharacterized protein n=1 Tax=Anguilla anguilla TaxID=7936 RepID=A0A0E9PX85_ANGAN
MGDGCVWCRQTPHTAKEIETKTISSRSEVAIRLE